MIVELVCLKTRQLVPKSLLVEILTMAEEEGSVVTCGRAWNCRTKVRISMWER